MLRFEGVYFIASQLINAENETLFRLAGAGRQKLIEKRKAPKAVEGFGKDLLSQ
jgi:hypothetical protein